MIRKCIYDTSDLLKSHHFSIPVVNHLVSHSKFRFISSLTLQASNKNNETSQIFTNKQFQRYLVAQKRRSLKVTITKLPKKFNMEWPKITLFGDSITRRSMDPDNGCWGSMIAHKVGSFFNVDPRGFEGYNSKWALELMPKLFPKSYLDKVEIFIPFFGHNDSWAYEYPPHLPLDNYEANMRSIVKYLLDNGLEKSKIILITPTWYHHETCQEYMKEANLPPIQKGFDDAKQYSDVILRIGKDNEIYVLDFFDISAKYEPLKEMFCDGIHYSRVGAKLLFDNLMPIIEKKIESSYKKPLADLWHVVPFDQHPEMKPIIEAFHKGSLKFS